MQWNGIKQMKEHMNEQECIKNEKHSLSVMNAVNGMNAMNAMNASMQNFIPKLLLIQVTCHVFFAQALPGSVSLLSHLCPASLSFFSWTASSVQVFSSCALSQAFSNLQKQSRIALDAPFCTTNRLGLFVCHSDASGLSLHSRTHVLEYCNYCN